MSGWLLALGGCIGEPPGHATDVSWSGTAPPTVDTGSTVDTHAPHGDSSPPDTGAPTDTGTPQTSPTGTTPVPVALGGVLVDCPTPTTVRFYAETVGLVSGGVVFAQETANAEPQWSEEHDLAPIASDLAGTWTHLEVQIADGTTLANPFGDWARNESTAFTCAGHITGPGNIMSYVIAVYDASGAIAACVAFGGDGPSVLDGTWSRILEPTFDLSSCTP